MEIATVNGQQLPAEYPEEIKQSMYKFIVAEQKMTEGAMEQCEAMLEIKKACGFRGNPSFKDVVTELGKDEKNARKMADIAEACRKGKFTLSKEDGPDTVSGWGEVAKMSDDQREKAVSLNILKSTTSYLSKWRNHPMWADGRLEDLPKVASEKGHKSQKSQPVTVDGFGVELLDLTPDEVLERLRALAHILPPDVVEAANDHDNPNFFACRALAMSQESVLGVLEPLTKKEQARVLASFGAVFQHNQKVFDYILKTERPKRIKAMEDRLKRKIDEADERLRKIRAGNVAIDEHGVQVMLRADFKRFLGALHPDKHPGQEEKYKVLFNDFKAYEEAYRG